MAPELYENIYNGYQSQIKGDELVKADVFALGVCLFILLCGFPPFKSTNLTDNCPYWRLFMTKPDSYWKHIAKKTSNISRPLQDLLEGMLAPQPMNRLPMADIRGNVWITEAFDLI